MSWTPRHSAAADHGGCCTDALIDVLRLASRKQVDIIFALFDVEADGSLACSEFVNVIRCASQLGSAWPEGTIPRAPSDPFQHSRRQ